MADSAITQLLLQLSDGDEHALHTLAPILYKELRQIAHNHLYRERRDHTLSTTALVHEAYLKLVQVEEIHWQNRAHFFATASQAMRRILVSYARQRHAQKRRGSARHVPLTDALALAESEPEHVLALHEALTQLATFDERAARIVDYRFFGGLTIQETAEVLGVSASTVKREWHMAKVWLHRTMSQTT